MNVAITDSHSGQRGGAQSINIVSESGVYALVFRSRKPEAKAFRKWVTSVVLPSIRKTGGYGTGGIYSLFSACPDMTIQRVNKLAYYLALRPPLSNADIARLLDVSDATVTYWRKRLTDKMAREAVEVLGINALGYTANVPSRAQAPALPAKKEAAV
jgi:prophage antirepressor-like protein